MPGDALGGQKRALDVQEEELEMVVSCHADAGTGTQVLCKNIHALVWVRVSMVVVVKHRDQSQGLIRLALPHDCWSWRKSGQELRE